MWQRARGALRTTQPTFPCLLLTKCCALVHCHLTSPASCTPIWHAAVTAYRAIGFPEGINAAKLQPIEVAGIGAAVPGSADVSACWEGAACCLAGYRTVNHPQPSIFLGCCSLPSCSCPPRLPRSALCPSLPSLMACAITLHCWLRTSRGLGLRWRPGGPSRPWCVLTRAQPPLQPWHERPSLNSE